MSESTPVVTVVMPVYNALPYLDQAIASIVVQTMPDFRLEIYDDNSDDGSHERALDWSRRDRRISVTRGTRRLGPCGSSNAAAQLAATEIVARMDGDDIAAPDRLAVQLKILADDPGAVLVGSVFDMIDDENRTIRRSKLGPRTKGKTPIAHASIMYRRSAFEAAGGYRSLTDYFEDQDLYRRMARIGRLLVVDRPLIRLRFAGQHARLRDDRSAVLERISLMYQPADAAGGRSRGRDIAPMAFYSVGVLAVLGLERPRLLALMVKRAEFRRPLETLAIMAFVCLGEVSPRAARGLNLLVSSVRSYPRARMTDRPSVRVRTFEPE